MYYGKNSDKDNGNEKKGRNLRALSIERWVEKQT